MFRFSATTPPGALLDSSPGSAHVHRGSTSSECCFWGRIDKFVQVSRPCSVVVQGELWCCGARGSRRLAPRRAALWFSLLFLKHPACLPLPHPTSSSPALWYRLHRHLSLCSAPWPTVYLPCLVQRPSAFSRCMARSLWSLCTKPPSHRSGGRGTREVPGGTSTP